MSAKIIELKNYERGRIHIPETRIVFPQLYRRTGYCWKFKEGAVDTGSALVKRGDLEPNLQLPLEPTYVLSRDVKRASEALPQWASIHHLDPVIDDGWVIVRHHATQMHLDGYLGAYADMKEEFFSDAIEAYSFEFGYFTVLRRSARKCTPNHLLVYEADLAEGAYGLPEYWTKVLDHEGVEHPSDVLIPDDSSKEALDEVIQFVEDGPNS